MGLVGIAGCSEQVPEVTVPAGMVHGERASPSAVIQKPHVAQGCNLETVNGQPVASLPVRASNGQIALSGWVAGQIDDRGELVGETSLVFSGVPEPRKLTSPEQMFITVRMLRVLSESLRCLRQDSKLS